MILENFFTLAIVGFYYIKLTHCSNFYVQFWRELSSSARHELLRIDKHSLFEQARKNMYCSRCNGLLLEAFSQIVSYSKGMQGGSLCQSKHEGGCNKENCYKGDRIAVSNSDDDVRDPSVHPWGGLMATRDNMLTLLDCFLEGQPLEVIQNVRKGFS